ncbi:MFS transporter [Mycolicibacterium sp. 018/SC-01/001]|uniref:MFS transporter n=1 Tax=Mycolicibacterium sp. 018/SC-01/001 TaxID=2592069 RepID=UPI00117C9CB7|nr:MFS transporter [Mycolicibacterium sp. 018/SC-01/001]TRW78488.1 MFS transporter [Mycolicibacterium sp. 018/SC-01/001]
MASHTLDRSTAGRSTRLQRPAAVLAVVLVAALAINVETTIVNVALPTLNSSLDASTRGLQWIVDAYNLAFAALVLAGGTIGDKVGRRRTLIAGLILFAAASVGAALCTTTDELIAMRVVMGVASALIYPTTLAIITDTFREPRQRAAAIGLWGAVTGLGVAIGPILGGALLEAFWWGSLFLALAPIALVAAVAAPVVIPAAKPDASSRLDRGGLLLSVVMLAALVYTIIEAPERGWASLPTLTGFAVAVVAGVAFAVWESRQNDPLIDVSLFTNLRFSAASGAVTVAFFALFGFIFLITQFMQLLQGFGPLETGVRILPVALSIAVGSLLGTRLAVGPIGTKVIVALGLILMAASFAWISTADVSIGYPEMAAQMVLLGGGLGLTSAPATESIMGVVRPEQAGAGSAVNDATRQVGGTLGVAVLGSVFSTLYLSRVNDAAALQMLPEPARAVAGEGLAQGLAVAAQSPAPIAGSVRGAVSDAFLSGLSAGCLTATGVCLAGALFVLLALPSRPVSAPSSVPA